MVIPQKKDRNSASAAIDRSNIDWNDPIYKQLGWDVSPVVIESHKLLFFTIPKNTCTEFKMLFRRMMGFKDWKALGPDEKPHNPYKNGLKYLSQYPREKQAEFMTSPDWTRAIFLRDPKERVLSAYMDKGLNSYEGVAGWYIKVHCCGKMKWGASLGNERAQSLERTRLQKGYPQCLPLFPFESNTTPETFPFSHFVERFMGQCSDPHWGPQSQRINPKTWELINFVGHMETLKEDGHELLRRVGAFEEFGREGWGSLNGAIFETNFVEHATSARTKMEAFYHPDDTRLEQLVLAHYRKDYEHPIMNMTKPESWERLMAPKQKAGVGKQRKLND